MKESSWYLVITVPDISFALNMIQPSETKNAGYTIPKHIRRAINCVESILEHRSAYMVGHIVEGTREGNEWSAAEVMNVQVDASLETWYYLHFLGRPKREDTWIHEDNLRPVEDIESFRNRLSVSASTSSPIHNTNQSPVWPGFFQLSQLNKQTTPGSSPYGSSSSGTHHDPHEYSPKTIPGIDLGPISIKAWYRSPYPREYWSPSKYLRLCQRCLAYGLGEDSYHECPKDLGGRIVYSKENLMVREINGLEATGFCERLFLISKLFLEDKRTSSDETSQVSQVTPFLFYALFEKNPERFVGYFSKYIVQKRDSPILSCIMVLPSEQRKGFGKLLISIAYELAKREGRQGSAERPLSGPGLAAFLSWWTWRLRNVVEQCYDGEQLSIAQLSELSGMTSEDVVETLRTCGALKQWGAPGSGDVKLRESGKRTKIKMTMDMMRALEARSPRDRITPNEFDPKLLSDNVTLCSMTPVKFPS